MYTSINEAVKSLTTTNINERIKYAIIPNVCNSLRREPFNHEYYFLPEVLNKNRVVDTKDNIRDNTLGRHISNMEALPQQFNCVTKAFTKLSFNLVDITMLYNKECNKQGQHSDYDPNNSIFLTNNLPLICICCPMESYIYINTSSPYNAEESEKVVLPANCLLIMRGDTIHNGSDFDAFNVRYHFYLHKEDVDMNSVLYHAKRDCDTTPPLPTSKKLKETHT